MKADTIAAISTTPGESGIGIVRLSGPSALSIAEKLFIPKSGKQLSKARTFTVQYGSLKDPFDNSLIDEALVSVMLAPRTYTCEDVVELNCHGGIVPLRKTLEAAVALGARLAEPGEFTKRAFLNGRIDLAQAEAVADIIRAKTEESLSAALQQLKGKLSSEILLLSGELKDAAAQVEAGIEFPEEEIETTVLSGIGEKLKSAGKRLNQLLKTAGKGKIIREGVKTVIAGKPNVGKSSLLNELLNEERAIVTRLPGTTRDVIEETINIGGLAFVLADTAGLRNSSNIIEKHGIKRTLASLESADLVLFILDGSRKLGRDDILAAGKIKNKKTLVVINKADLPQKIAAREIKVLFAGAKTVSISALKASGIETLKKEMHAAVSDKGLKDASGIIVTNLRHKLLLEAASAAIMRAETSLHNKMSEEFIALDIREALDHLGEITGKVSTDDILDRIFSEFCIGK